MKLLILFLVVPLLIGALWQSPGKAAQPPKTSDMPLVLVDGNNRFAIDLYHCLAAGSKGDVFVSPESISLALAMTYAGAAGQTAEQMAATLHFTLPREELNAAFARLLKEWSPAGPPREYQLNIANRLWAQQGYKFLDSFLKVTRDDFGAELAQVDFVHQAESARETINAWVAKQTADKIKDLIGSGVLGPDTRLVLTNAIYFRGRWQSPFESAATAKVPFHVSTEKTADVPMMRHEARFGYGKRADVQILEMPYKVGDLSMVVILPTRVDGLADLEKSLATDSLKTWLAGLANKEVDVALPKFKITQEVELSKILSAMGMPLAFSDSADFSGMDGRRDLAISAVIHKAYVDVDEKGTEAAAATAVTIRALSARIPRELEHFTADHPFIFLIRDTRSGSILFIGRYTGPT
jgi:serpin B